MFETKTISFDDDGNIINLDLDSVYDFEEEDDEELKIEDIELGGDEPPTDLVQMIINTLIETSTNVKPNGAKVKKHNYTSELELKTFLIRLNSDTEKVNESYNRRINKYVKLYEVLSNIKYKTKAENDKRNRIKSKLKDKAIELSEKTNINTESYELFGRIVIMMINKILTRPCFYTYTYTDEFYSDALYKILKYRHNFNHKLISNFTKTNVNAFAYISQIIHNSILFIIKKYKKLNENQASMIRYVSLTHDLKQHNLILEPDREVIELPVRYTFPKNVEELEKILNDKQEYDKVYIYAKEDVLKHATNIPPNFTLINN